MSCCCNKTKTVLLFEGREVEQGNEADAEAIRECVAYLRERDREAWDLWKERVAKGFGLVPPPPTNWDLLLMAERWLRENDGRKADERAAAQASLLL